MVWGSIYSHSLGWYDSGFLVYLLVSLFQVKNTCILATNILVTFSDCLCKAHFPFTVGLHCIYSVISLSTWHFVSGIYLAHKSKRLVSAMAGAEDTFLAWGRWCFHSSYPIFRALPVGNRRGLCWDLVGNWGTEMGLMQPPAPPALLGSALCVPIPETQAGQWKWAIPAALLWKLGFQWSEVLLAFAQVLVNTFDEGAYARPWAPFGSAATFHPGSSLLLFRCFLMGL